jgi:4-hydroxythreonine-4-phosphate dehydrogenase
MHRSHSMPPTPPAVLVTCGDPAGIGPEIVAATWSTPALHERARLRVVSDVPTMTDAVAVTGRQRAGQGEQAITVEAIAADDARASDPYTLLVIEPRGLPTSPIAKGTITAIGGQAAVAAVETAFDLVRAGHGQALVTGPLHKEALRAAGRDEPGHTELLARACGLSDEAASMMLWLPSLHPDSGQGGLGVVHATLHESLRTAVQHLSTDRIVQAGRRIALLLEAVLGRRPRLAVAALNPHAGEGGLFGDEEQRIIAPAVTMLAAEGLDVAGPLPADTLFLRASQGRFDGVVALYHDQGHIPVKLLGMHRAVNITLGLPIIRTSVAHGTAFDIVGTGTADPSSMRAAVDMAIRLAAAGWPSASRS